MIPAKGAVLFNNLSAVLTFFQKSGTIKRKEGGFGMTNEKTKKRITDLVYIALFTSLIAVCSWISVPFVIPFTLQTFAVFVTVALLGGKRGTVTVVCYLLLGLCGVPVFSRFNSGPAALFGATGGYLMGFVAIALIMWAFEKFFGKKTFVLALSMLAGLGACYIFGSLWYTLVYMKSAGGSGFVIALTQCVLPFILPDVAKLALALVIQKRLGKYVK